MNKPLISIIVPVYNVKEYLPRCIDSIINQTYDNIEILLIDDGSQDGSGKICDEYKLIDNRIKVFHIENGGVSRARNYGFTHAKGEYIGFVDADDWVDKDMYKKLYNLLVSSEADLSVIEFYYEYENKTITSQNTSCKEIIFYKNNILKEIIDTKYFGGYLCNKLFKKSIINKFVKDEKLFDENIHYCEDLLFTSTYGQYCNKAVYLEKPYYHYNKREGSSTLDYSFNNKILSLIKAYEKIIQIYSKLNISNIMKIKYFYLKINCNIKYRVLKSDKNKEILDYLNKNIKKYYYEIINSKNITIKQKINTIISVFLPQLSGDIKLIIKKALL